MRSAIQANRGQVRILQGLPAKTPETPVLNLKNLFIFLKFSHFHFTSLFLQPVPFTGILYPAQPPRCILWCPQVNSRTGNSSLYTAGSSYSKQSMQIFSPFMTTQSFSTDAPVISLSRFLLTFLFEKVLPADAITSGSFSFPTKIRP
jgi:hypothetical protein